MLGEGALGPLQYEQIGALHVHLDAGHGALPDERVKR
jgi:hypothetical protein